MSRGEYAQMQELKEKLEELEKRVAQLEIPVAKPLSLPAKDNNARRQ